MLPIISNAISRLKKGTLMEQLLMKAFSLPCEATSAITADGQSQTLAHQAIVMSP